MARPPALTRLFTVRVDIATADAIEAAARAQVTTSAEALRRVIVPAFSGGVGEPRRSPRRTPRPILGAGRVEAAAVVRSLGAITARLAMAPQVPAELLTDLRAATAAAVALMPRVE